MLTQDKDLKEVKIELISQVAKLVKLCSHQHLLLESQQLLIKLKGLIMKQERDHQFGMILFRFQELSEMETLEM
jgi:hypothetical protein